MNACDVITYRPLERSELGKLREIDRSEIIDGFHFMRDGELQMSDAYPQDWIDHTNPVYRMQDGQPVPVPEQREIPGFHDIEQRIVRLLELYDAGGVVFGAFDGGTLVGMSVLENRLRGERQDRMQLAGLWISRAYRRRDIGRCLVELVKSAARERGAAFLYICGFPSRNTVSFYRHIGCTLADPDPELLAREPDDIHFELALA